MPQERSRTWQVAQFFGLVEEPGSRPVGSAVWWRRIALGGTVGVGTVIAIRVVGLFG